MPRRKSVDTGSTEYNPEKPSDTSQSVFPDGNGLFLLGEVTDRVKKRVTAQGMEVEVVTYTVVCDNARRYYVDDFDPDKYYAVGEKVTIPVYVKAYKKKTGEPSYMLKLQKKEIVVTSRGEHF